MAQPHPFPETLINAAPEAWFQAHTRPKGADFFHPEALSDYLRAVNDPYMIQAMCEDYRAAASVDLEDDRLSRAQGRKLQCPLLALWGAKGKIAEWYDAISIWRAYSSADVTGAAIPSGHYLAEEAPEAVLDRFLAFFV